jgi:hypothetical protein
MKTYLVYNEHEWVFTLDKLFKCGYRWSHNEKYEPALSFDEFFNFSTIKGEKFPLVILADNDKYNDLHYSSVKYIKQNYPKEYIKMIRMEKIKRIHYENR